MRGRNLAAGAAAAALAVGAYAVGVSQNAAPATAQTAAVDLWETYTQVLKKARYIDLTHTITPNQPVWKGFGPAKFSPTVDPATGEPYTFAEERLRGHALRAGDRPVRHPARPARALGARVPGDRRAAGDLRRPPAGRDLDRHPGQEEGRLPPAGLRHQGLGEGERPDSRGVGRDGPLGLVEEVDDRRREGQGARRRPGLPGRRRWTRSSTCSSQRKILFHGHEPLDTDTTPTLEGEALADAQRLHAGRGRRQPRRRCPRPAA